MNNLNSILIEGNLVREPQFKITQNGTALCIFSIATNRSYKREAGMEKEVSYFDIQTWGKLAEACNNLGKKGRGVRVTGRLKQERWQQDGQARSKVIIVAERVEFRPEFKKEHHVENNESHVFYGATDDEAPF